MGVVRMGWVWIGSSSPGLSPGVCHSGNEKKGGNERNEMKNEKAKKKRKMKCANAYEKRKSEIEWNKEKRIEKRER